MPIVSLRNDDANLTVTNHRRMTEALCSPQFPLSPGFLPNLLPCCLLYAGTPRQNSDPRSSSPPKKSPLTSSSLDFVAQDSELTAQYIYYKQIPHDNHIILPCIFPVPDRFGSRDKTHPTVPAHLFFSEVESHPYLTHKLCSQVENLVTRSISIYIITLRPKYR